LRQHISSKNKFAFRKTLSGSLRHPERPQNSGPEISWFGIRMRVAQESIWQAPSRPFYRPSEAGLHGLRAFLPFPDTRRRSISSPARFNCFTAHRKLKLPSCCGNLRIRNRFEPSSLPLLAYGRLHRDSNQIGEPPFQSPAGGDSLKARCVFSNADKRDIDRSCIQFLADAPRGRSTRLISRIREMIARHTGFC